MKKLVYSAIDAAQSIEHKIVCFVATAEEILQFAAIDRIGRDDEGQLRGFQRPQIAAHIREIKEYLEKPNAVLPNPIVVAFTDNVAVKRSRDGAASISIDISKGPPGFVVDGQQRLSTLALLPKKKFKAFVSAVICKDEAELRRQFVLINNTRPLPKSLIYELLPTVDGLPHRFDGRSLAADLAARLNYDRRSSLRGLIHQHTNPDGIIRDTAIQRVIMNSLSDGVMRELVKRKNGTDLCFDLISEFYRAVQSVFAKDWNKHTPTTSRLVHGAGIVALGYVMELLALLDGARNWEQFAKGLGCLDGRTAWTSGQWDFGGGDIRHWRAIQNVNKDIVTLAHHLIGIVKADLRNRRHQAGEAPLLAAMAD